MNNLPPFTNSNPDLSKTIFPDLEEKLGRKLSIEENLQFLRTSGMRKEWFYSRLKEIETPEQVEKLFAKSIEPPAVFFGWDKTPTTKPLGILGIFWEILKGKLYKND